MPVSRWRFAIPRGRGEGVTLKSRFQKLPVGKGELLRDGDDLSHHSHWFIGISGTAAAERLAGEGIQCAVVNARFAKPLDTELILRLARRTRRIVTVEENALAGGFGSAVMELLCHSGITIVPDRAPGPAGPVH